MRIRIHPIEQAAADAALPNAGNNVADPDNGSGKGRRRVRFLDSPEQSSSIGPGNREALDSEAAVYRGARSIPELSYQLDSGAVITIAFSSHACRALRSQCAESGRHGREVGGILVGYNRQTSRLFRKHCQLTVTDVIPVESRDSSSSHISFGQNAWFRVQEEISATYFSERKCRLGWFHTHPNQGIFFSDQDREAHAAFKKAFEFALVVDPRTMDAGLFYWRNLQERTLAGPIRFSLPS